MKVKTIPWTPRMRQALNQLLGGDPLPFARTSVGRPTKQRLAKYGLAEYLSPGDWDGEMRITAKGRRFFERHVKA